MNVNTLKRITELRQRNLVRWMGGAALGLMVTLAAGAAVVMAGAPGDPESIEAVLYLASQDRHEEAVQLFERIKKERPETIESIHGHKVAVVYAAIGNRTRHEAHCRWLMDRYRDAVMPTDAERSVKGYLLFPSAEDPALLDHALERARLAARDAVERGEGQWLLWFVGSQGMAEYRSGNYAEAVTQLEKAAKADNLYISSLALPFQAMAEFAQGNHERAGEVLAQAQEAAALLSEPGSEEYLREWTDTLTTQIALREAERVITGDKRTQDDE
jgi:hypothetical protein